jgi:hypothetical protein
VEAFLVITSSRAKAMAKVMLQIRRADEKHINIEIFCVRNTIAL